jgi:hypothetical protein
VNKTKAIMLSVFSCFMPMASAFQLDIAVLKKALKVGAYSLYTTLFDAAYYAKLHEREIIVGALGGTVSYLFCRCIYLKSFLARTDLWSCWSSLATEKEIIAHEFVRAVQLRYIDAYPFADFEGPLGQFMFHAEGEIRKLQEYVQLVSFIKRLHLDTMFHTLIDEHILNRVEERIDRLEKLKKICLPWMSKTICCAQ